MSSLTFVACVVKEHMVIINKSQHRSSMQTEKSQSEGKRIMPETRFTEFPALSVDPGLGFLGLHRIPVFDYFSHLCH